MLVTRLPIPCTLSFCSLFPWGTRIKGKCETFYAPGFFFSGIPLPVIHKETIGYPKFPDYPCRYMNWSQTPVVSYLLTLCASLGGTPLFAFIRLLPSAVCRASAFIRLDGLILMSTTIHFSGLNTVPTSLIHSASYFRYRFCTWVSLLPCRLHFRQMGVSCLNMWRQEHPLGNNIKFHVTKKQSQWSVNLARAALC